MAIHRRGQNSATFAGFGLCVGSSKSECLGVDRVLKNLFDSTFRNDEMSGVQVGALNKFEPPTSPVSSEELGEDRDEQVEHVD
jgi:hypothetical protein